MSFLTRVSLRNRLLVALVAGVLAVFGVVSTNQLNQELIPSIQTPGAYVIVAVPGASPEALEQQVTEPLETGLTSVPDLDSLVTTTSSGTVTASVTWPFGSDSDSQVSKLQTAVDRVTSSFPENAIVNVVTASLDSFPVVQLAFTTSGDHDALVDRLEQTVVPALQSVEGVQAASLAGQDEQRVGITLRPDDVEDAGVDTSTLAQLLQANGVVVPAGSSESGELSLPIQVGSTLDSVEEVADIAIPTIDGPVRLSEIADVELEPVPETSVARVDGRPALTIGVTKTADANLVSVSHAVSETVAELEPQLGSGVEVVTVFDQAPYIEQSIEDLLTEGGLGLLFAVLVILVFLWAIRPTIIAAISIPMSLLITLTGLWIGGFTLNIFTLGALTIAIGRVVDDSIVVIENIKRRQRDEELTPRGIVDSVAQVAGAITASTITTVAVFLPIAFVTGIAGELFRPFAVTVTIALLSSLVVALTIVPTLAYWFLRRPPKPVPAEKAARREAAQRAWEQAQQERAERRHAKELARAERDAERRAERGRAPRPLPALVDAPRAATAPAHDDARDDEAASPYDRLQRPFVRILDAALRHRLATLAGAVVVLLGTLALASGLKIDFLSQAGQGILSVSQEMPLGSSLATTDEATRKLEAVLDDTEGVENYVTTIGGGGSSALLGGASGASTASISVTLVEDADEEALTQELSAAFDALEGVGEVTVGGIATGGLGGDIALEINGEDLEAMGRVAEELRAEIAELPVISAATSNLAADQPVLTIDVDHVKAAEYGYTPATVGQAVAAAVQGQRVGTVTLEGVERDIVITPTHPDASPEQIREIELPVTALQNGSAQQQAAEDYAEEQQRDAEAQQAAAEAELRAGIRELETARRDTQRTVSSLQEQLAAAMALRPQPDSPRYDCTADPGTGATDCTNSSYADDLNAWQQGVSALQSALAQASAGLGSIDGQIVSLEGSLDSMAEQRAAAEEAAERQEEIQGTTADPITVGDIATVSQVTTPATIVRDEGDRQVTVSATPQNEQLAAATVGIQEILDGMELPEGVTVTIGGVSQQQEESFAQLGLAMLIAIALVFLIMVATFRSLVQPLILLVSIPFAATGALLLLLVTGTPLGLPALIGLLMLIGIVVTNAIVLIDLVNKLREHGASLRSAVIDGARLRLRPILMTAAATVFALVPMSLGLTGGGVFISQPLAIVVIGGLISSTLLTLVLVPVLYTMVEDRAERGRARRAERRAAREAVARPAEPPALETPSPRP